MEALLASYTTFNSVRISIGFGSSSCLDLSKYAEIAGCYCFGAPVGPTTTALIPTAVPPTTAFTPSGPIPLRCEFSLRSQCKLCCQFATDISSTSTANVAGADQVCQDACNRPDGYRVSYPSGSCKKVIDPDCWISVETTVCECSGACDALLYVDCNQAQAEKVG